MHSTQQLANGPEGAPAVLLCPALGTTLEVWAPQAAQLAGSRRVIRYDLPGHGGSAPPAGPLTMADLGRQALAVLDNHGIQRAAVGGLSLGGMVALWLALHAPERVEQLVLCATAAFLGPPERWLTRAREVRTHGLEPIADALLDTWLDAAAPEALPDASRRCRRMITATTPCGFAAASCAVAQFDARGSLMQIKMPALVMSTERDRATPLADGQQLADAIPGANLTVLPGTAHLLSLAWPDQTAEALIRGSGGHRWPPGLRRPAS